MEKIEPKIVVFSDLKDSIHPSLSSAIGLAKALNGRLELFTVINPGKVVQRDNQLSAMRSINDESVAVKKKMDSLLETYSRENGIKIGRSYAIGNVKIQLEQFLKERKPDIVVLGRRAPKPLKIIGDRVTEFIIDLFNGFVLVAPDTGAFIPNPEISIGGLNVQDSQLEHPIARALIQNNPKPWISFKIAKNNEAYRKVSESATGRTEFVFDHNVNVMDALPNYIRSKRVDLLLVNRERFLGKDSTLKSPTARELVNKVDAALVFVGAPVVALKGSQ